MASALATAPASSGFAFKAGTRRSVRLSVVCKAAPAQDVVLARRAAIASLPLFAAALAMPKQARALIPDEEDEEMLERAKANRAKRLEQQRETTREFLREEGLKNSQLDQELLPVQRAVNQLAKSGSQLEAGDVRGASSTLSGGWTRELTSAAARIADSDTSRASADSLSSALDGLKSAASSGDLAGSKRAYVSLVGELQGWASAAGVTAQLKGL
jgi:hypothetical protein